MMKHDLTKRHGRPRAVTRQSPLLLRCGPAKPTFASDARFDIAGSQNCGTYSSHPPRALDQCRACEATQRTDGSGPDGGAAWQPLNQSIAAARCSRRKGAIRLSACGDETFVAAGAPDPETEAAEALVEVSERSHTSKKVWIVHRTLVGCRSQRSSSAWTCTVNTTPTFALENLCNSRKATYI